LALNRGPSLHHHLDRITLSRVNHRANIKTILVGIPADLATAGRPSICSSPS
jgi:hypothetical protein